MMMIATNVPVILLSVLGLLSPLAGQCYGLSSSQPSQKQPPSFSKKTKQKKKPVRVWPPRRERLLQDYTTDKEDPYFSIPPGGDGTSSFWPYSVDDFRRDDEYDDTTFYEEPRLSRHVDEWALLSLKVYYGEEIESLVVQKPNKLSTQKGEDGKADQIINVLDLCSSWMSHLPDSTSSATTVLNVTGVGMNAKELQANPQLSQWYLQDLNQNPQLRQFEDNSFDLVLNTCSVDYLTDPKKVFEEVYRVTKPGGTALVAFSNRYFRSKAVRVWLLANDEGRQHIVASYFYCTGTWESIVALNIKQKPSLATISEFILDPNYYSIFRWLGGAIARDTFDTDPIYVVKAVKNGD